MWIWIVMRDLCGCCDYAAALNLQPHNHSESSLHNTNHLARGICHRSVIKLCNVCTYTWRMRSARRYLRPELFYSSRDGRKIFRAMINQLQRTRWRRSHTGDYFDWLIGWLIGRWWWWWLDGQTDANRQFGANIVEEYSGTVIFLPIFYCYSY